MKALGRHTVAALLNGASADVDADMTAQEVIDAFNAAFPSGDISGLHGTLAGFNEQGCPLAATRDNPFSGYMKKGRLPLEAALFH